VTWKKIGPRVVGKNDGQKNNKEPAKQKADGKSERGALHWDEPKGGAEWFFLRTVETGRL